MPLLQLFEQVAGFPRHAVVTRGIRSARRAGLLGKGGKTGVGRRHARGGERESDKPSTQDEYDGKSGPPTSNQHKAAFLMTGRHRSMP